MCSAIARGSSLWPRQPRAVWVGGESVSVAVRAHSAPRLPRRSPMPAVLPGPALYPPLPLTLRPLPPAQVRDVLQQAAHEAAASASAGGAPRQASVVSPMPGKLVKLLVEPGQPVKAGEPLLVLEAMKMEHTLRATADAVVERTFGREGDVVPQRAVLVSFEAASS